MNEYINNLIRNLWKVRYAQNQTLTGERERERDDTYALLVSKHRASHFLE
jgi:hypothetical protein